MKILVIGAGRTGARVLRELQKNPALTLLTADPSERPYAVEEGIISKVDILEALTPLNLDYVCRQAEPDLIILARTSDDLGLGIAPGIDILNESLRDELIAGSAVPMIEVSRRGR